MVPLYPIEVIGLLSKVKVDAAVDTCFEGEICLPATVAIELGLVLIGREEFEYADGRKEKDYLFAGEAIFMGEQKPISIVLTIRRSRW
jgi:predicted aspartyl protease